MIAAPITRRAVLFGSLTSASARAVEFGKELQAGEVTLIVDQPEGSTGDELLVALRTTNPSADYALVEVFYRAVVDIDGRPQRLLLHQESVAPLLSRDTVTACNRDFDIPKRAVQFIRVTLFQTLGPAEEFR